MVGKKLKRSWDLEEDVVEKFDRWTVSTGMVKNAAAQLGLWILMEVPPDQRQAALDRMNNRAKAVTLSDAVEIDARLNASRAQKQVRKVHG